MDTLLQRYGTGLSPSAKAVLKRLAEHKKPLKAREDLLREGEIPSGCYFLLEGFACRYKLLPGGRRAVVAYLLPGDFCGNYPQLAARMDHGVVGLSSGTVAHISRPHLQEILHAQPDIADAFSAAALMERAIQRQWLANMACPSDRRLAHLFCELRTRLALVGLTDGKSYALPLTQQDMGEAMGISTVHVNRTLQHLREMELLRVEGRVVEIADPARLESFADFDPAYLDVRVERDESTAIAG